MLAAGAFVPGAASWLRVVREKSSATRGPSPGLHKTDACSGSRCTPCHELLSGVIHASIYRLQTSVTPVKEVILTL